MVLYRLNTATRVPALEKYSDALLALAEANAAALQSALPGNAALLTLRERRAALTAAHAAWTAAYRARVAARILRDKAQSQARAGYTSLYKRVKLLLRT